MITLIYSRTHIHVFVCIYLLGLLKFLSTSHTFGLVLGAPQLGFGVCLRELPLNVSLAFSLFFHLLTQIVQVVLQVTELAQKSRPLLQVFRPSEGVTSIITSGNSRLWVEVTAEARLQFHDCPREFYVEQSADERTCGFPPKYFGLSLLIIIPQLPWCQFVIKPITVNVRSKA